MLPLLLLLLLLPRPVPRRSHPSGVSYTRPPVSPLSRLSFSPHSHLDAKRCPQEVTFGSIDLVRGRCGGMGSLLAPRTACMGE
jgi:hypothetical protein